MELPGCLPVVLACSNFVGVSLAVERSPARAPH